MATGRRQRGRPPLRAVRTLASDVDARFREEVALNAVFDGDGGRPRRRRPNIWDTAARVPPDCQADLSSVCRAAILDIVTWYAAANFSGQDRCCFRGGE